MKTGMIVCDASKQGSDGQVGIYDCAFYLSSEGHTVSERCIFEHRAGRSEWIGAHFYFVDPNNTSKSVYDGLASFDVWGGSTLCISGFISKSPNKTYLKFPADNCNNARVEVFYDDKENYSTLGWFTGGSESTKQYFQVTNAFMQFTTSGKVNGVAGALGLEFGLGALNKTTTDPLLKITGTFKVNPGSTITVNAGGKSAGTYKLISAGTLNDGADLVKNSSVENCASGHYGVVTKSGNNINLVVIKGTPPSTGDTVIDPTAYGSADTASSTYTWRGYTGPWAYTTNWTASASANYGIPNNGTYATADFPAALENEFTCTLNQNVSVKYAKFDAPNMTLVIDNAALTVNDRANPDEYLAYGFGTGENAGATLEFRGASAGIVSSKSEGRCMFGLEKSATDKLRCTIRFIVPASGWESTAPIRATGGDCSVYFWYDAKLVIDATALGVPAENEVKTALLATATDGMYNLAKVEITCADGAKGSVAVDGTKLVLTVEADETTEPEEPQLTAVDAPEAVADLVYTGSELTGVVASDGYTLTDNTATDAGTYEATATLAEGYKWSDDTTEPKTISWSIAKATNEWTTEPKIEPATWTEGEAAGTLTAGVAKFGEVTSSMTELPTEVGSYTITYTVAENNNYNGLTKTIEFTIKAAPVDPEPDPEPDPEEPKLEIDSSFGYIVTELGEFKDQVAVVFTNSAKAASWKAPKNLKNVEILVVGGGGGGGGHYYSSTAKNCQGGAGGGGGAVVTGFITELAADQVVNVTVGAGGAGGTATTSATTGAGKGGNGGNTVLKIGDVTYVTAYGGGGDGGYNSAGVANGGSNSGVRGTKTAAALKSVTVVGEGAENLVTDIVARANKGGGGYTTSSGYPGAGGGGAGSAGGASGGSSFGGTCGYGYVSMITDTRTVYGAGGGGGIGKSGGTGTYLEEEFMPFIEGAGLGVAGQPGSDALANQGAGGGGGSYKCAGGAGGSGIVVLRFAYVTEPVSVDAAANILPKITDKSYTGSTLTSGLENTYAYTVEELGERINFGQQTVRVTLNDGYVWADGDTNKTKEFTWNITQEVNNWKVEPYLSHTTWPQVFASTVNFKFTAPETSFGVLQAELSANGAAPQPFSGTLPTEPGSYTLRYWVEETANWAAKEWTVNFKIYRSEEFAEGYKVYGLGENGDEVAVVFTQNATWTVPDNLKSAQFLVVGGGGGGGADSHYDAASGGAGGGGGGVVTGEVDLIKAATVAVTIGAGGAGGQLSTDQKDGASSGSYYGGSKKGGNTVLKVDDTTYVTAYGGGRDQGVTKKDTSSITTANMSEGGQGGSNGGSRGGITADQSKNPTMGAVASNAALRNCTTYGNKGGKGCSESFYGYPSAGGGGGATEAGGDAGNDAAGWAGGKGGEGLASDITGARVVYGSGGGGASTQGASGGIGGTGAGNGGDREDSQGTSALANQGGGGGGSSRETTYGGAGGSGIVVIRYTLEPEWTPPMPEIEDGDVFNANYTNDVVAALKAVYATSVDVKVNGVKLKGDNAVKALNTAVMHFDNALTFDGTAASLDIVIKVTEVNTSEPEKSKFEVTRGATEEVLEIKEGANIKTSINEIDLGSDAVIFRLVIE